MTHAIQAGSTGAVRAGFTGAVRAELLKFFTTRLWWGMAIAVAVCAAGFSVLFGVLLTSDLPADAAGPGGLPTGDATQVANSVYTGGVGVGYLLMLTIGVLQIGSEYRHKTITGTLLSVPRRARAMAAKVVALLGLGALYGLLSVVVSVGVGALVLQLRDVDPFPSTEVVRTIALSLLVLSLWALIGLGVGILIPNQVAALLIGVGAAWIVEPIVGLALRATEIGNDHIAPYLPTAATNAVLRTVESPGEVRLEWWLAALVLAAYAAVLAGFGTWRVVRQDIS